MEVMLASLVGGGPTGGEAAVFGHLTFNTLKGPLLSPDSANASRADRGRLPHPCRSVSHLGKPLLVEDGGSFT